MLDNDGVAAGENKPNTEGVFGWDSGKIFET